ncbi:beta-1,6-N-acetylglucosaminyltransferase [Chitinophaga sp. XS-30]|uniref:beta-1,6-N-acetylglucosaminyltransferase n=1 Tax=Chitinophaga sp. XS-30 TaxID=2604421 RepID=UPI0011DD2B66|nr:beta-1,6-N-acetylglucosaminyltransferase [Chitinophaga sp. XS-30]QEH42584.1 beta-1,6-N-acetylglucosaminyltransferase [Chitinophaga sp. XS-30]
MKIAFVILCHKNPGQLERLLLRLQHPRIDCYIHLDGKSSLSEWETKINLPRVRFIRDRVKVTWAGYGTIAAAFKGIEAVLASEEPYASIHLISAQDYPLVSAGELYDFFAANAGKEYLDILTPAELKRVISKITQYHFEDLRIPGKYRLTKLVNQILPARKHPLGMEVFGGSLWWSLTRECAAYCLDFVRRHPALVRFYKYTWGGDEFIFQTIIMNSPFREQVVQDNLRYIDWSEGNANPRTFTIEYYDTLMHSGKLLARKFDLDKAPLLLDKIDAALDHA